MCIQDIQIARAAGASTRVVSVGTTAVELVPQSYDRYAMIISAPLTGRITISTLPNVTDGQGIILTGAGAGLVFGVQKSGQMVMQRLFAVSDSGTLTVGIMESILPQGFASARLT